MAIHQHLLACDLRIYKNIGVLIIKQEQQSFLRTFARVGKICTFDEEQKLLGSRKERMSAGKMYADYQSGRDLMLFCKAHPHDQFTPLMLSRATDFYYVTEESKVHYLCGAEIAPQLVIHLPNYYLLLGQDEDYLQSVCESAVALAEV